MKYQTANIKYAAEPIEGESLFTINWDMLKQYIPSNLLSIITHYGYFIMIMIILILTSIIGMYVLYRLYLWIKKRHENDKTKPIEISPIEIPVEISPIEIPAETMSNGNLMRFIFHPIVVAFYELKKLFGYGKNKSVEDVKETTKKAEIILKDAYENVKHRMKHVKFDALPDKEMYLEKIKVFLDDEAKKLK